MKQFIINEDFRNTIISVIADSRHPEFKFKEINQLLQMLQQLPETPKVESIIETKAE